MGKVLSNDSYDNQRQVEPLIWRCCRKLLLILFDADVKDLHQSVEN